MSVYEFDQFRLDPGERRLSYSAATVTLAPKSLDTLIALVENAGLLLRKEVLRKLLWPDTFVGDATLARNISDLRAALAQHSGAKYIETVSRHGYRFIREVQYVNNAEKIMPVSPETMGAILPVVSSDKDGAVQFSGNGLTPSIAVLPFANLSGEKENEYFSDGLAEEILNLLAKVSGLRVIARTSSFGFRGKEQDIRKIAQTLGTANLLEGSVRRVGSRLRVTAQLVRASDGSHLWSERYDCDVTDVFAIQDEIGQAITDALHVRLASRAQSANIEAYQCYLKGQYHRVRYTPESLLKAKDYFERALAIDPTYALAYNGLAAYYYVLANVRKPARDVVPFAKAAAEKALSIDPTLSEARSVLAASAASFDYDWDLAETQFCRAMKPKPVLPMVRHRYAYYYLIPRGQIDDAIEQSRLALETDPLAVTMHVGLATSLCLAKQYKESVEQSRRALEIESNSYLLWVSIGFTLVESGDIQEAIASLERAAELAPWLNMVTGHLATAYYLTGDKEYQKKAETLASQLGESLGAATYYAATGEEDLMFRALDAGYRQRDSSLLLLPFLSLFDRYRADPRFHSLLRQMNLA